MKNKLWSRQELCKELKISMRTLCRRLEILGIQEVSETLPNGVPKKYVSNDDFLRLKTFKEEKLEQDEPMDLIPQKVKMELIETRLALERSNQIIAEKELAYNQLREDHNHLKENYDIAAERNEKLFSAWMDLNEKYQVFLESAAKKNNKGFWSKLFKRGKVET